MYALQCTRDEELELYMGEFFCPDKHHPVYAEICFPSWLHQSFTKGSFIARDDDKICDRDINKARIFETKKQAVEYLRSKVQIDTEVDEHLDTSLAAAKRLFDIVPIYIVKA